MLRHVLRASLIPVLTLSGARLRRRAGLVAEERLTLHEGTSLCLILDELQTARAQAAD